MTSETRRARQRRELIEDIVGEAESLLAAGGPSAVSLRAIARAVGMSAPSLYTYFASLDDLFTELIVRSYGSLAAEVAGEVEALSAAPLDARLRAGPSAYRSWALVNRQRFNLIFFDQIVGYEAPAEGPTVEAQTAVLRPIASCYAEATGSDLEELIEPGERLDAFLGWWGSFHGLVALEVNHHLDWVDAHRVFEERLAADVAQIMNRNR